jgi:hypothetical protein
VSLKSWFFFFFIKNERDVYGAYEQMYFCDDDDDMDLCHKTGILPSSFSTDKKILKLKEFLL